MSVQISKPSTSGDSSSAQSDEFKIYSIDCETIHSGINIFNNYLNKTINLSHCSAIVFSEEVAKEESFLNHVNALGNDSSLPPNCNILISSGKAIDVLNKVSNSGSNFSSRLYENIVNSIEYTGYTIDSTFAEFFLDINNSNSQSTAIYTIIDKDSVQNAGIAVFKNKKMIGTLSPPESIAHLAVNNELESCIITIENPLDKNTKIDLKIQKLKSPKINVKLINNTPFININIFLQGSIISSGENFDYTNKSNIQKIEENTNLYFENLTKEYLHKISKDYNSDISNFYGYIASKYLTYDAFEKIHWNEIFKDSYFNVNVDTKINSSHLFNKE